MGVGILGITARKCFRGIVFKPIHHESIMFPSPIKTCSERLFIKTITRNHSGERIKKNSYQKQFPGINNFILITRLLFLRIKNVSITNKFQNQLEIVKIPGALRAPECFKKTSF